MGRILTSKRITLWMAVAPLIIAGVLPLCLVLATSLTDARNYTSTLGNPRIWGLFRTSLVVTVLTTMLTGLAGVPLGILLARTDFRDNASRYQPRRVVAEQATCELQFSTTGQRL